MRCPSCGQEEIATVVTNCPDPDEPNERRQFSVCRNCDYGINEHTEGECDCLPLRCEATVHRDGQPTFCDKPLDERGYCGYERYHVDA